MIVSTTSTVAESGGDQLILTRITLAALASLPRPLSSTPITTVIPDVFTPISSLLDIDGSIDEPLQLLRSGYVSQAPTDK